MSSPMAEGSQPVPDWLCGLRLDQYCSAFQDAGLRTLLDCRHLTSARLELMGVALPGHRKRILGSLQKLFPSERDWNGEEENRPVPLGRTKFRSSPGTGVESLGSGNLQNQNQNVASNLGVQDKALPPIPPRHTPNRPPVPFTPSSVTVETTLAMSASSPVSPSSPGVPIPKPVSAPVIQTRPVPTPTPRSRPDNLPLKEMAPKQQSGEKRLSPVSPSVSSSSSLSSASEQFHLYEQCSSPAQAEKGIPPLPPKSYAIGIPREPKVTRPERPPRRPPIPPRTSATVQLKTSPTFR